MRSVLACLLAAAALGSACGERSGSPSPTTGVPGEPVVVRLSIEGMHCDSCVEAITAMLEKADGVISARVDLATESAEVTVRPGTSPEAVAAAVRGGYVARVAPAAEGGGS